MQRRGGCTRRFWDLLTDTSKILKDRSLELTNYRALHVRISKARESQNPDALVVVIIVLCHAPYDASPTVL